MSSLLYLDVGGKDLAVQMVGRNASLGMKEAHLYMNCCYEEDTWLHRNDPVVPVDGIFPHGGGSDKILKTSKIPQVVSEFNKRCSVVVRQPRDTCA